MTPTVQPRRTASVWIRRALLAAIIAGLVITWVALAELLQVVQHDKNYNKPFFLTYVVHGSYIIFWPVYWAVLRTHAWRAATTTTSRRPPRKLTRSSLLHSNHEDGTTSTNGAGSTPAAWSHTNAAINANLDDSDAYNQPSKAASLIHKQHESPYLQDEETPLIAHSTLPSTSSDTSGSGSSLFACFRNLRSPLPFTGRRYAWATFIMQLVFFFVSATWYYSLDHTSVAANTGIYNSSCIVVFILSALFLKEKVTKFKVAAVALSVGGVLMISFAPSSSSSDSSTVNPSALGYIMVVVSTVLYAAYEVLYRMICVDVTITDRVLYVASSFKVLGYIGFWNLLLVWPVLILCHYTGWELFELPSSEALPYLVGAALIDSVFQILLYLGILISSPLFIAVGCMLSIPGSIVADYIFHGTVLPALALGGIAVLSVGFALLNYDEYREQRHNQPSSSATSGCRSSSAR